VLFSEPKISQSCRRSLRSASAPVSVLFSEPKISQWVHAGSVARQIRGFSALQRAENFSIRRRRDEKKHHRPFQCSSASRKFLNSRARLWSCSRCVSVVSVLFSEPKISQSVIVTVPRCVAASVSVLFSEPKISQSKVSDAAPPSS